MVFCPAGNQRFARFIKLALVLGLLWCQIIDVSGLKFCKAAEYFRHQWVRVFKAIGFRPQHNNGKRQVFEFPLMWQIFVHREEDIEFAGVGNEAQKFSVLYARPARVRNGLDLVARQIPPQTRGQAFIQENSHLDGLRNGREHRIGGLFKERNSLFASNGWEIFQELIQRVAAFEVIHQCPRGNARAGKTRLATHDFRIGHHNALLRHAYNDTHLWAKDNCKKAFILAKTSTICRNVNSASRVLIHGKQLVLDTAKNQRVQPRAKIHLASDDGREFLAIAKVLEAGIFHTSGSNSASISVHP